MLTIIIIALLLIGVYAGVRRGLVLQLVHTIGYLATFYIASMYYRELADKLYLLIPYPTVESGQELVFFDELQALHLDSAFYYALAYVLILIAGWIVIRILGHILNSLTFLPIIKQLNSLGGAVLGFVTQYVGIFILLYIMSMVPVAYIQNLFLDSSLAQWMITQTPVLSRYVFDWVNTIIMNQQ